MAGVGLLRLLVLWAGRREVGVAWACGRGGEASMVDVWAGAKEVAGVSDSGRDLRMSGTGQVGDGNVIGRVRKAGVAGSRRARESGCV